MSKSTVIVFVEPVGNHLSNSCILVAFPYNSKIVEHLCHLQLNYHAVTTTSLFTEEFLTLCFKSMRVWLDSGYKTFM